jgi:hypothetical protein
MDPYTGWDGLLYLDTSDHRDRANHDDGIVIWYVDPSKIRLVDRDTVAGSSSSSPSSSTEVSRVSRLTVSSHVSNLPAFGMSLSM